jgi:hypothetical protein
MCIGVSTLSTASQYELLTHAPKLTPGSAGQRIPQDEFGRYSAPWSSHLTFNAEQIADNGSICTLRIESSDVAIL